MIRVSNSEFQRRFAHFRRAAEQEPIVVTHHDRDDVVLLPFWRFQELLSLASLGEPASSAVKAVSPNLKAPRYFILQGRMGCPECDRATAVFAVALPAGYECLEPIEDDAEGQDEAMEWTVPKISALLCRIEYLPSAIATHIQTLTPNYRPNPSTGRRQTIWTNHCERCGAAVDDALVHDMDTPDGPFDETSAASIHVHEVAEAFEARATVACDDPEMLRAQE